MAAPLGKISLTFIQKSSQLLKSCKKNTFSGLIFKRTNFTTELRKFYKNARIAQSEGWFEINLDQRKLRTPGGNLFRVPNEALALAVATEWNSQDKTIKRHSMHLTSLCNTAIDNPMHKTRENLITGIIHFLETDTVSFRNDEPEELLKYQQQNWDPVIDWVEKRYDIEVPLVEGCFTAPDIPKQTIDMISQYLRSHSDWALFGLSFAADALKSLVLTLALMDKFISVEQCVALARLEQDYQVQYWGNVEWYHDIDIIEQRCRLAAATLFVHWSQETTSIKEKCTIVR